MTERRSAVTRAEEIRARIAEDIVRGHLSPGSPLEEIELARAFNVSRTPVREAIRQLEAEGFATARPRRGAVVATIAPDRLHEMFEVMAELEALCAGYCARAMTLEQGRGLEAVLAEGATAVAAGEVLAYSAVNERFHDLIYGGSGNQFLADLALSVRRRCAPFRRAQFYSLGRLQRSHEEHSGIVAAILRGDAAAAAAAMRAHIGTVEKTAERMTYSGSDPADAIGAW
ncbi:MAG: FCD domain-containing protein [Azospirillum sp.]|nr:FCD domain-containing protein [Azospirillum sp.]